MLGAVEYRFSPHSASPSRGIGIPRMEDIAWRVTSATYSGHR